MDKTHDLKIEQLKNIKIKELDKDKILLFLDWFEEISDKSIIDWSINIIEKLEYENDEFKKEIFMIKFKNIINKLNENKFIKKIIYPFYSIYYYNNKIIIYLKRGADALSLYKNINEFNIKKIKINKKEIIKKKIKKSSQEVLLTNSEELNIIIIKKILEENILEDINICIELDEKI